MHDTGHEGNVVKLRKLARVFAQFIHINTHGNLEILFRKSKRYGSDFVTAPTMPTTFA